MAKISEDVIRAVENAAKIEEVVGDFVRLRRAGVNMTGLCPFHDDENDGNFIVRPSTVSKQNYGNTYHCFVCGKGGGAVKFLMEAEGMSFPDAIRWLGKKYCIPVDDVPVNWVPPPPRPLPPPLPLLELPRDWIKETGKMAGETPFVLWLWSLPWNEEQRARLGHTLWLYCVGGYRQVLRDRSTRTWSCFWQIDEQGVPRAAKLMYYHDDGHRGKEKRDTTYLYALPEFETVTNYRRCQVLHPLFGAHLLKRFPQAAVNVVESEKTAIIMQNYYGMEGSQLWLAVGGLQWLKLESMQVLVDQGRKVWLWPDKDGIDKWRDVAAKLGSEDVRVYTDFFDSCWLQEDGEKADCADIVCRMLRQPEFKPRKAEPKAGGGNGAPGDGLDGSQEASLATSPADFGLTEEQKEMLGVKEWAAVHEGEAFLVPWEVQDVRVREWREILRERYNFNKSKGNYVFQSNNGVATV